MREGVMGREGVSVRGRRGKGWGEVRGGVR